MKITSVELYLFDIPLPNPLANPITSGASIATILAVVRTDKGITGQGYGWTIGSQRARFITGATEVAAQFALGRDPTRMDAIWSDYEAFSNFVGTSGLATMGMSILDIAFWDIACRAQNLPLWRMLGGHKDKARMYLNLISADASGKAPTDELHRAFEAGWASGYRDFKARMGLNPPMVDADRVRSLVESMDGKGQLAIDIAQRWGTVESAKACYEMDDIGLMWIEDPLHQDNYDGMRNLVESLDTPICTGENAYGVRGPVRIMDEIGCPYVMLDLERCGGITGWRKAAAVAETRSVRMTTHVYPHIGVHLVCGTPAATIGEYLPWWDDLLGGPIAVTDGYAVPGEAPGVGAEVASSWFPRAVWKNIIKQA